MASNDGSNVSLVVKWAGKEYSIDNVAISSTVNDLKSAIHAKTNVLPSRQKLLNLRFKGKAPTDDQSLTSLNLKNGFKIMMMGSVEQAIQGNYFIEQLYLLQKKVIEKKIFENDFVYASLSIISCRSVYKMVS